MRNPQDISMHFLMENAIANSRNYTVLSMDDVDARRKELQELSSRIEATQQKLALERKARDANLSIGKLPLRRDSVDATRQGEELAQSARKCRELEAELDKLRKRQESFQVSVLEHTAGVLQATHKGYLKEAPSPNRSSPDTLVDDFGDASLYRPYTNFLEHGDFGGGVSTKEFDEQTKIVLDIEHSVEELNTRMRDMILEFKPDKGDLPQPARELRDDPDNPNDILHEQIGFLEQCLDSLDRLQKTRDLDAGEVRKVEARKHEEHSQYLVDIETRVENLNAQLREIILDKKPAKEDLPNPARELRDDPNNPKEILEGQVGFLERCLVAMQKLQERERAVVTEDSAVEERLQELNTKLFEMMTKHYPERASKFTPPPEASGETMTDQVAYLDGGLNAVRRRLTEYGDENDDHTDQLAKYQERAEKYAMVVGGLWDLLKSSEVLSPGAHSSADFSLSSFQVMVESLHRKSSALEDQKAVLTRQIQQQRELNATADTTKDAKLTDAQEQLAGKHAELEGKHTELADAHAELAKTKTALQEFEGEAVRLQTELAMAKADLDSAHGTRAQRAAEAQAGEVPELRARIQTLTQELGDTISDYEAMTKASIEFEKEREALENGADALRDRVEMLESQLAEERIQTLGVTSPTGERGTGAAVLKAEFRKMMKETRAEHSRAMRVRHPLGLALSTC